LALLLAPRYPPGATFIIGSVAFVIGIGIGLPIAAQPQLAWLARLITAFVPQPQQEKARMTHDTRVRAAQALDALLTALNLSLDTSEHALALDAICDLAAECDDDPHEFARQIVGEIEKIVGRDLQCATAMAAVEAALAAPQPRELPPDWHLEMQYEERVWGGYSD
jgi:hypothetical protein